MSALEGPKRTFAFPQGAEQEKKILAAIERPHSSSLVLPIWQQAILIDNSILIGYKPVPYRAIRRRIHVEDMEPAVWVTREKALSVIIPKDDSRTLTLKTEAELERERGQFGTIFVKPETDRPIFYIGEDYKIKIEKFLPTEGILFDLHSVNPISSEMVVIPTTEETHKAAGHNEAEYLKWLPKN